MKTPLFFLLVPALTFAQNRAITYEEANPGVLHVNIDVSSDTAHLQSLIGKFSQHDVEKLKVFLNSPDTMIQKQDAERMGDRAEVVEYKLRKLLNRKIDPCRMMASSTRYAIFNSPLENDVIKPLIVWVEKNYYMCQMVQRVYGFEEAKQKIAMRNNKNK